MVAEADGNRTRQGPNRPLTGVEDRGTHQASVRLHGETSRLDLSGKRRVTGTLFGGCQSDLSDEPCVIDAPGSV